jgi:hypothetical protein
MLVAGIPLYVCATASTPIAAALILKGVSPGVALVFLLAGPATNLAALTMMVRTLGIRSTAIYLAAIAGCAVLAGLAVDGLYAALGLSAQAMVGQGSEAVPRGLALAGAGLLLLMTLRCYWRRWQPRSTPAQPPSADPAPQNGTPADVDRPGPSACGPT